jgi:hypothetical protein
MELRWGAARTILAVEPVMYALPPRLERGTLLVTGVSCPDCGGVLMVRAEGRDDSLVFECRIGNTLDVVELLAAKEERLDELLWSSHTVLEELIALLHDLVAQGAEHGETPASIRAYGERAVRARANASALRKVIDACRPVNLAPAEPGTEGVGGDTFRNGEPATP